MPSTLAQKTPLSGADYFQLVLDQHIRKHGTVGNVSRVVIELDGKLELTHLQKRLGSLVIFNWMKELRMKREGLRKIIFSGNMLPVWNFPKTFAFHSQLFHPVKIIFRLPSILMQVNYRLKF